MILCIQLLQTHVPGKILIKGKFPHPAWLYVSLQLLQMHIYAKKILVSGKFPYPVWLYASSSYKCTIMYARKSSQMENFLTQYDSMHPALTNTHAEKILTNGKFQVLTHAAWLYVPSSGICKRRKRKWKWKLRIEIGNGRQAGKWSS